MKLRDLLVALVFVSAYPIARAETIALVGGTVHPVSGPDLPGGTVVMDGGKIVAVGAGIPVPANAKRVDVTGKHVYPSLLPPITVLGLLEIDSVRQTRDTTEIGDINPEARADLAINLDSELLPVARSGGILVAGVSPNGGLVSGSVAVVEMDGWTREDATVRSPAAIFVNWPDLSIDRSPTARLSVRAQEKRRDEAVRKLKDVFLEARAYGKARAAEGKAGIPRHDRDARLEAFQPALERKVPVIVAASSVAQIRAALAWAAEEGLDPVLFGAEDGWRIAGEIARAKAPVILECLGLPRRADEPYDAAFGNAGVLDKAGVRVAINQGGGTDASNVRNLNHEAAAAAAFGLPREKAVAAITLEPARILGVADRVGSLEPGKDATLIVTDGDVLDLRSHVVAAYLRGRALDLGDRQKRLYERYRNRPRPASPR